MSESQKPPTLAEQFVDTIESIQQYIGAHSSEISGSVSPNEGVLATPDWGDGTSGEITFGAAGFVFRSVLVAVQRRPGSTPKKSFLTLERDGGVFTVSELTSRGDKALATYYPEKGTAHYARGIHKDTQRRALEVLGIIGSHFGVAETD